MMIKKVVKKTLRYFGYVVNKIDKENKFLNFDEIYKNKINPNPIIFDVGSNQGQSIERFTKIFDNPIIHAFEPIEKEFEFLKKKYERFNNIKINHCALGDKNETKKLSITAKTGNSSFNEITPNTKWLKTRSKEFNTTLNGYVTEKQIVKLITLDEYCFKENIKKIDILKMDTQGYEDKILFGSKKILEKGIINSIESEIMFDNVYKKYFNFSDLEKYLIPNHFRLVGINLINNNLFSGTVFYADILYFNKKKFKL